MHRAFLTGRVEAAAVGFVRDLEAVYVAESVKSVVLKKGGDKRLRSGHMWVFSNELESIEGTVTPGDTVHVVDGAGHVLGTGYMNPNSLIAVRLLARSRVEITPAFLKRRLKHALAFREKIWPGDTTYRAVYSESDLLPGLIVDRYGSTLAIQSLTAGIEIRLNVITELLDELLKPDTIVIRNDSRIRVLEGLPLEKKVVKGNADAPVEVDQDGTRLLVDVLNGQKTGLFLDQRENRQVAARLAAGRDVLDCCCYTGAWSLAAAAGGATSVTGFDSSAPALDLAGRNATLNGLADKVEFIRGDMFRSLAKLSRSKRKFGLAFLDPPGLAKNRKRIREALRAYRSLNRLAMSTLSPGGFLVTSTCSHLVEREAFLNTLVAAAREAGRHARVVEVRSQSRDHPVILGHPETEYLACVVLEML